jgi:hypothetical protein
VAIGKVAVALAAGALAACSGPACTLIGCASSVGVDLSELATTYGRKAVDVTLCVDAVCRSGSVDLAKSHEFASLQPQAAATRADPVVHVRVEGGGRVLVDAGTTAHLASSSPNGEGCAPVCYQGTVTVHGGTVGT